MDDLTNEFIAESRDGLDRMERCLTTLESRPDDAELISDIFRTVHSIKGTTGFLGLPRLETLAHAGENVLGLLRDGRLPVTTDLVNGLLALLDGLRKILSLIERTGGEGVRAADHDTELIAGLHALADMADGFGELRTEPVGASGGFAESMPSPLGDGFAVDAGEEIEVREHPAAMSQLTAAAVTEAARSGEGSSASPLSDASWNAEKTLRIDVDVLNRMMNLVGELVLTRNQILQTSLDAQGFAQLGRRLDSVTADLRETVMQARMQPVGNVFNKFPRMVRDLANTCGKLVRIEFSGQETGLDKSLLEAIKDPLTHAVRNAVDHGIEAPAMRAKVGKPAVGLVRLRAFHQGGSVVLEVIDDGAGIGLERVRAKAVERKLVSLERAEAMTERDVLQLVFLPGFSTAVEVTHVSGRGVGMDVVRENVEKAGGTVELESRPGHGTTLRLRVPLTLAIVPALVVVSGGQSFALPQSALVELVYIPMAEAKDAVERMGGAELYRLRDRLLPMVRLDRLLGIEEDAATNLPGFYLAVLEVDGLQFGLVLDDLLAPEEIVVKPLSPVLREIGLFSGATVLGNGTLALILDVTATANRAGVGDGDVREVGSGESEAAREDEARQRFLIFKGGFGSESGGGGEHRSETMAIPLEQVERIESVSVDAIEYAGGWPLLQYRGETIPLEDDGGLLASRGMDDGGQTVTVLICVRPAEMAMRSRRLGLLVKQVFQVTTGTLLAPVEAHTERLALVDGRITTVHAGFTEGLEWPMYTPPSRGTDGMRGMA